MFDSVKLKLKGSYTFIINFFIFNNIKVYKPICKEGYVNFYIKGKDFPKANELIKKKFGDYEIIYDASLKSFFNRNIKRIGLFAGLIAVIICSALFSLCTTNLVIKGNNLVAVESIESVIKDFYEIPNFNKALDNKTLINKLILLDGISSASVEKRGNTVFVEVYEELPQVPIVDKTELKDIVSQYDAIITRLVSFSGTAVKKQGDVVKKGDTLIESKVKLDEENKVDAFASGEAYGRVTLKYEIMIPDKTVAEIRTEIYTVDKYFNKMPDLSKVPFKLYEMEKYSGNIDYTLTLPISRYKFYELKQVEKDIIFEGNEEFFVKEYTEKYMDNIPSEATFKGTWHDVKRLDKKVCLVIYYEIETKIT